MVLCFLVLNRRSLARTVVNQPQPNAASAGVTDRDHTRDAEILQYTSGGRVHGFPADSVYVAGGSPALRVEFRNARATRTVSDLGLSDGGALSTHNGRVTITGSCKLKATTIRFHESANSFRVYENPSPERS
jgi:hypothetical protein